MHRSESHDAIGVGVLNTELGGTVSRIHGVAGTPCLIGDTRGQRSRADKDDLMRTMKRASMSAPAGNWTCGGLDATR